MVPIISDPAPPARGRGRGGFGGRGYGGAFPSTVRILLSYPSDPNDLLLSGGMFGGEALAGKPALVHAPLGKGHLVLFGFRPFHRYITQGNWFLAFNAILNWNDLSAGKAEGTK